MPERPNKTPLLLRTTREMVQVSGYGNDVPPPPPQYPRTWLERRQWAEYIKDQALSERKTSREIQVYEEKKEQRDRTIDAFVRVGGLLWLNKGGRADRIQRGLLSSINSTLRSEHIPGRSCLPTDSALKKELDNIEDQYHRIIADDDLASPDALDRRIHKETRELSERLTRGVLDDEYDRTPEEEQVAHDILTQVGQVPAKKLQETLAGYVFASASDVVEARDYGALTSKYKHYDNAISQLKSIEDPRCWYAPDWLTSRFLMRRNEREMLENTIMGFTPENIVIRRLASTPGEEDYIRLPLRLFNEELEKDNRMLVLPSTLERPDDIRKAAGLIRRQDLVNHYLRKIGGVITLSTLQRDKNYSFAVQDAPRARNRIIKLGQVVDGVMAIYDIVKGEKRKTRPPFQSPVRFNRVMEMLPPHVLELDIKLRRDGPIEWLDWTQGIDTLYERKKRLQQVYRSHVLRAARRLDGDEPRPEDGELIDWIEDEIRATDEKTADVEAIHKNELELARIALAKETQVRCPYCNSQYSDVECPGCSNKHPVFSSYL